MTCQVSRDPSPPPGERGEPTWRQTKAPTMSTAQMIAHAPSQ